jgi:hypothetical protein
VSPAVNDAPISASRIANFGSQGSIGFDAASMIALVSTTHARRFHWSVD